MPLVKIPLVFRFKKKKILKWFIYFYFLVMLWGMWDLSSWARDPTLTPCVGNAVLTAGTSEKVLKIFFEYWSLSSIFSCLFVRCLTPPWGYKPHRNRKLNLFWSLLLSQHLEQCLAHMHDFDKWANEGLSKVWWSIHENMHLLLTSCFLSTLWQRLESPNQPGDVLGDTCDW